MFILVVCVVLPMLLLAPTSVVVGYRFGFVWDSTANYAF